MTMNNSKSNEVQSLVVIPLQKLDELIDKQNEILGLLTNNQESTKNNDVHPDYVTELKAKKMLGKGTTWFWQQRQSGILPFSKVGRTIYYRLTDIQSLLK
jgi:hypothetical protein